MSLIRWLKITMATLLIALFMGLAFSSAIISATIAIGGVPDKGATLIATMQDGDVNVYSTDNTSCSAIVGQLHGKTVALVCP